jgi:hypothetical protein
MAFSTETGHGDTESPRKTDSTPCVRASVARVSFTIGLFVPAELPLKPLLKRGALIAAANWQVTLIQATADSLFKLLIATPMIGGLVLVGLVIGTAPEELMSLEWREMAATIITSLLSHPAVLTAFLASLAVMAVGGSLFIFLIKAGSVAVLVRGEREAGAIEQPPLHFDVVGRASKFSAEYYIESARALFPRYARLGFMLMAVYLVSGGLYLAAAYESGFRGDFGGLLTLCMTAGFVSWITLVNLVYLLMQIVMAADDCSVAQAWPRLGAFVRHQRRGVSAVFGVVLALVVAATGVSLLATAALGLIAFVPFVGLAVLPLQLLAWVFRGVVFQFLALASIGAYLRLYREFADGLGRRTPASAYDVLVPDDRGGRL